MSANTIILTDEGQIPIPDELCAVHNWQAGQELVAIAVGDGILLKPKKTPFSRTTLEQVAGCLVYDGPTKTLDEMDEAIRAAHRQTNAQGIEEQWNDRH